MTSLIRTTFFAVLLVASLGATTAYPCAFHNYVPQVTLVDQLLGSEEIVMARPALDNPFRYEALSAPRGRLENVEIPQRVNSATRHKFTDSPTAYVLLARRTYGPWRQLAFVDAAMAPVIDGILKRLPSWEAGSETERVRFFAAKIGHPDIRVHRLALRELVRLDYAELQALNLSLQTAQIAERMNVLSDASLQPIQILLLGLSDAPEVRSILEDGVKENAKSASAVLGAYATALIENVGPAAVLELSQTYLADSSLPMRSRLASSR